MRAILLSSLVSCLLFLTAADELAAQLELEAPDEWIRETIELPPAFAPEMNAKGVEELRFSPDMFERGADGFFSYVFVFELEEELDVTKESLSNELLIYYQGLCKGVLGAAADRVDVDRFSIELESIEQDSDEGPWNHVYEGTIDWLEPFVTRQRQSLSLELHIHNATDDSKQTWFVCVSPSDKSKEIWTELRQIRTKFEEQLPSDDERRLLLTQTETNADQNCQPELGESFQVADQLIANSLRSVQDRSPIEISRETTYFVEPLTAEGDVDLLAAVNQLRSQGVTEENNAAIPLLEIVGPELFAHQFTDEELLEMGFEPPSFDQDFLELPYTLRLRLRARELEHHLDQALHGPWQASEYPEVNEWILENSAQLDQVVAAVQKPRLYVPFRMGEPDGGFVSILLPHVQSYRSLARALVIRANLYMGEDRLDEAWKDLFAIHQLADRASSGGTLIEFLVACAIDGVASAHVASLIGHDAQMSNVFEIMQKDMDSLEGLAESYQAFNLAERLMMIDIIVSMSKDKGDLIENIGVPLSPIVLRTLNESNVIKWTDVAIQVNQHCDQLVDAMKMDNYRDRIDATEAIVEKLTEDAEANFSPAGILKIMERPEELADEAMVSLIAATVMPGFEAIHRLEVRAKLLRDANRTGMALRRYQIDFGEYPDSLEDLSPEFIEAVPMDTFSSEELTYHKLESGFMVYSVGQNLTDDGGLGVEDAALGDDAGVKVGH